MSYFKNEKERIEKDIEVMKENSDYYNAQKSKAELSQLQKDEEKVREAIEKLIRIHPNCSKENNAILFNLNLLKAELFGEEK